MEDKRKSFTHPVFISLLSIAIVIAAVVYVRGWENERLRKDFNFSANTYRQLLESRFRGIITELDATKRFFEGSTFVNRMEFSSFVSKAIIKSEEIKAISWVPKISSDRRQSFESSQQGLNGRLIHVHDHSNLDNHNYPAPPRENYYPVLYAEPARIMDDMTGFELGSNAAVQELLEQARDDGVIVPITGISSPYFMFTGNENIKSHVSFVQPVYRTPGLLETIKQRREALRGFLLLQFDIGRALEASISAMQPKGIDIYIVDVEADEGAEIVYHHRSRLTQDERALTYSELWKNLEFGHKSSLDIPGRQWKVMMVPQPQFFEIHRQYQSWGVLLFGLLLSALLSYVLLMNQRRTNIIRDTVKVRTKALEDSETNKRAVIDNIAEGIVTISERGIIESFNPAAENMFGYLAAEAIGNNVNFLLPNEERAEHDVYIKKSELYSSRIINKARDLYGQHKNGKLFPIELNVSRMELNGEGKFIGIMHEISSRVEAEQKIRESREQAMIANRAKSDLMANMSHELRTPLNAIIGFSESMKTEIFGSVGSEKNQEYLNDIHQSGQHLLNLINDILDVSAIEAGALELHEENINLTDVVDASIRLIHPRADAGQVIVTASLDPEIPLIFADRRRIMQVILNLLSNAVKFTPKDGEVSITACLHNDGSLSVMVADTGSGMDAKGIDTAMSQFGQVDSGLNRKHEGTGLGLPLTMGLMELHGGTLGIKSKKGNGTLVTVTFPKERVI